MADRDAALVVAPLGLPADLVEMPPGRIEIEVEMQVDIDVELLRQIEDLFEMRVRIGVHVGTAADRFAAVAQRRDQQFLGAGIVGQAFLRKHADREIDRPGIVALQRLDRLEAAQADARIDLDMGAHPRGAVHDGALDHLGAARVDVLDREIALHGRDRGDGLRRRCHGRARSGRAGRPCRDGYGCRRSRARRACRRHRSRPPRRRAAARSRRSGRRRRRYRPGVAEDRVLALRKIRSKAVLRVHGAAGSRSGQT